MDTGTTLRFLSSLLLSLPIISLLFLLLQLAVRAALSFVLLRMPDPRLNWSSLDLHHRNSPSTTGGTAISSHHRRRCHHHQAKSHRYAKLRVSLYTGVHAVECAVCLNEVKDGDEVRELKCNHFFHKGCLDGWVDHGWSSCPLCREALAAEEATRSDGYEYGYDDDDDDEEEEEEDEMSPSGLLYMVCLGSGGW